MHVSNACQHIQDLRIYIYRWSCSAIGTTASKSKAGVGIKLNCVPDEIEDVVVCDAVHAKVEVDLLSQLPAVKITAITAANDIIVVSKEVVHYLKEGPYEEKSQAI